MYSRKIVGPRMEFWGTPALTEYSHEDFPSRTTQSHLLLRNEEIRPNIWPEIGYIKCYSSSSPSLLNTLAILSDTTVRRSAVDRKDLKAYWKSEKNHISLGDQQSCYLQVFQRLY